MTIDYMCIFNGNFIQSESGSVRLLCEDLETIDEKASITEVYYF